MLAQRVAGDTPVRGTLPKALPNGGGYPSFFDANAIEATTDKLYFEVSRTFLHIIILFHMAAM